MRGMYHSTSAELNRLEQHQANEDEHTHGVPGIMAPREQGAGLPGTDVQQGPSQTPYMQRNHKFHPKFKRAPIPTTEATTLASRPEDHSLSQEPMPPLMAIPPNAGGGPDDIQQQERWHQSDIRSDPVEALDLRIGKASEAISLFQTKNVLLIDPLADDSTRSEGGGPVASNAGLRRDGRRMSPYPTTISPQCYPTPSTSSNSGPSASSSYYQKIFESRAVYRRSAAETHSPSPPPPPTAAFPAMFHPSTGSPSSPSERIGTINRLGPRPPHSPEEEHIQPQYLAEHLQSPDPRLPALDRSPPMAIHASRGHSLPTMYSRHSSEQDVHAEYRPEEDRGGRASYLSTIPRRDAIKIEPGESPTPKMEEREEHLVLSYPPPIRHQSSLRYLSPGNDQQNFERRSPSPKGPTFLQHVLRRSASSTANDQRVGPHAEYADIDERLQAIEAMSRNVLGHNEEGSVQRSQQSTMRSGTPPSQQIRNRIAGEAYRSPPSMPNSHAYAGGYGLGRNDNLATMQHMMYLKRRQQLAAAAALQAAAAASSERARAAPSNAFNNLHNPSASGGHSRHPNPQLQHHLQARAPSGMMMACSAPAGTRSDARLDNDDDDEDDRGRGGGAAGKRGRPRKHAVKIPLPPLYVFIRNMLHNRAYNPSIISWVNDSAGIFKVNNTAEFARTWGRMKSNRSEEMNYEKMSRAMRYHYGNKQQGRKGHLAMVKEKRLVYRFGELAINWRKSEVEQIPCDMHDLCKGQLCLWSKE